MTEAVAVTLPCGRWRDGRCTREATVRPITGADERFLLEGEARLPAERSTALLDRCVTAEAGESARSLTVGDREALLLHLRRLTFGEKIECVVTCPGCGEPHDVELFVADLLVPPDDEHGPVLELETAARNGGSLRFRLPTGGDQETAAARAATIGVDGAAGLLLRDCLESAAVDVDGVAEALEAAMASHDPQAEIALELACVRCGRACSILFDAGDFLFRELTRDGDALDRDVHELALHYHWSEAEILALPVERRLRYLELLTDDPRRGSRA